MAVAARRWRERIAGRNVIVYIDNDSARGALIKGYSPALPSAELLAVCWTELALARANPWFARVPGPSNIADGPSRLEFAECLDLGIPRVDLESGWEAALAWQYGQGVRRAKPRTGATREARA